MKNQFIVLAFTMLAAGLTGCGKDTFNYYRVTPQHSDSTYSIKEMTGTNKVDVVWIIDNSASMGDYQQAVIDNSALFMQDFITQGLDWKMGLISTDQSQNPFVGFAHSIKLDSTVADPTQVFSDAVDRLGISGSGIEMTFTPILKALRNDSTFERAEAPIVFIIVTDAREQSGVAATTFLSQLKGLIGATRSYYAYGVFAARDHGCPPGAGEEVWDYAGSPYESFIKSATGGTMYPICQDFGPTLANMGHDIVTRLTHPSIFLSMRPNMSTLHVYYHDVELPPGDAAQGGYWKYDYSLNAIVFNSLSFSTNDNDAVQIKFEEDTGV